MDDNNPSGYSVNSMRTKRFFVLFVMAIAILEAACSRHNPKADATPKPDIKIEQPKPPIGMEFTANLLKSFPERVENKGSLMGKIGWMDCAFGGISNDNITYYDRLDFDTSSLVGFIVFDKDGNCYDLCFSEKNRFGDLILSLKDEDKIRLFGQAVFVLRPGTEATFDALFRVDFIQILKRFSESDRQRESARAISYFK